MLDATLSWNSDGEGISVANGCVIRFIIKFIFGNVDKFHGKIGVLGLGVDLRFLDTDIILLQSVREFSRDIEGPSAARAFFTGAVIGVVIGLCQETSVIEFRGNLQLLCAVSFHGIAAFIRLFKMLLVLGSVKVHSALVLAIHIGEICPYLQSQCLRSKSLHISRVSNEHFLDSLSRIGNIRS
jgi:hypothetical protein